METNHRQSVPCGTCTLCCQGDAVDHANKHLKDVEKLQQKVDQLENVISDVYDFQNSLKETQELYIFGQQPFYIYAGIIKRVDKIIKKFEKGGDDE